MRNWEKRNFYAFWLFILGTIILIWALYDLNNGNSAGPGSGLVILLPIIGAILGYILGSIVDFFNKKV